MPPLDGPYLLIESQNGRTWDISEHDYIEDAEETVGFNNAQLGKRYRTYTIAKVLRYGEIV